MSIPNGREEMPNLISGGNVMSKKSAVKTLPAREEIPVEDTWALEQIFATDDDWKNEFKQIKEMIPKASDYQGKLGVSAEVLYEALQYQDEVMMRLGKLYTYAHMRYDQDTTNSFYQSLNDQARSLYTEAASAFSYVVPELLSIDEKKLQAFLNEKEDLKLYEHALEMINKQRPHILTAEIEAILAQVSDVTSASSNTFGMLNNADLEFPTILDENDEEVQITHGRYITLLESSNRRVRHDAFKGVYDTYGKFRNTFASTLSGQVKRNNFC